MPEFFGDTLDSIMGGTADYSDGVLIYALKVGATYIGYAIIAGIFLYFTRQTIIKMSRHIEYDLKNEVYEQYQKLGYNFFRRNRTGDLMNRISEDVTKVRMYLGPGLLYTINLSILSILVITQMVRISGYLTIFVLTPLPIMSYLIYRVSSKMNRLSTIVQEEQSNMSTLAQEYFSGIRVVKAYSQNEPVKDKFHTSAENYKKKNMRLVLVNALFMPTIFGLIGLSTLLVLYIGGLVHYTGDITQGDIVKYIFYVNMLTWPFASVGWVTSLIQRAEASQARINEFLKEEPEIVNSNPQPIDFKGKIEFRNVTYTYPNSGLRALNDLSFIINPGETLGVIGRTGSGKSTIINLLMRQIEPDSGEILIDDKPIKEIDLEQFRDQTGVVPQEVFLFSDSIANNLAFGALENDISEERLIEVTKQAHVYHNIEKFEDQFNTILGERGVNLSGGQKQRLSIARALIRKPKLLILDDCLSAVDTETEEIILDNLKRAQATSSLVISHRVSSLRNANRIINIDEGRLTEEGTHEELLKLNGHYAELYHKQLAEEEKDN